MYVTWHTGIQVADVQQQKKKRGVLSLSNTRSVHRVNN